MNFAISVLTDSFEAFGFWGVLSILAGCFLVWFAPGGWAAVRSYLLGGFVMFSIMLVTTTVVSFLGGPKAPCGECGLGSMVYGERCGDRVVPAGCCLPGSYSAPGMVVSSLSDGRCPR